ncbi:conserved hypothetical protein [Burkholderia mallei 2002721280]|nr:conserved hypothetical protein [Burkholderia mallei 2002721280]
MDDPRERRVARDRRHPIFERAGFVDRARVHRVALGFLDGQALARDRRLVDGRAAGNDLAVEADALAGLHAHDRTERDLRGVDRLPRAVGLPERHGVGREAHQALDRVARTVERARLDQFGDGEEHHHHRGLGPLANRHRARHRDAHQRVDVQVAVRERDPALAIRAEAAGRDRGERERGGEPYRQLQPRGRFRRRRRDARDRERPPRARRVGRRGQRATARRAGVRLFGRHAERADRGGDAGFRARHVLDREHPLHQVEFERRDFGHRAQLLADQCLLGRAVHLHDPERRAHTAAGGLSRAGQRRERDGGGRAARRAVVVAVVVAVAVVVVVVVVRMVAVRMRMGCMCVVARIAIA